MDTTKCECGREFSYFSLTGFVTCTQCNTRFSVPISDPLPIIVEEQQEGEAEEESEE
jgi:hypothetical protein